MRKSLEDRKGINLQIEQRMIDQIEEVRGHTRRAEWIRDAIQERLDRINEPEDKPQHTMQKAKVTRKMDSGEEKVLVDKVLVPHAPADVACKKHAVRTMYKFGLMICLECGGVVK